MRSEEAPLLFQSPFKFFLSIHFNLNRIFLLCSFLSTIIFPYKGFDSIPRDVRTNEKVIEIEEELWSNYKTRLRYIFLIPKSDILTANLKHGLTFYELMASAFSSTFNSWRQVQKKLLPLSPTQAFVSELFWFVVVMHDKLVEVNNIGLSS